MQIASTYPGLPPGSVLPNSTGLSPGSGLSPVPNRRSDTDPAATENTQRSASTARDASTGQRVAPALALLNGETSRALVLARQRSSESDAYVQLQRQDDAAVAKRAVAAYNAVAGQEQRYELDAMLVGIDVFV